MRFFPEVDFHVESLNRRSEQAKKGNVKSLAPLCQPVESSCLQIQPSSRHCLSESFHVSQSEGETSQRLQKVGVHTSQLTWRQPDSPKLCRILPMRSRGRSRLGERSCFARSFRTGLLHYAGDQILHCALDILLNCVFKIKL